MSRPKPSVLIEYTNKVTYKTEQVLASEGVWAVFFEANDEPAKELSVVILMVVGSVLRWIRIQPFSSMRIRSRAKKCRSGSSP